MELLGHLPGGDRIANKLRGAAAAIKNDPSPYSSGCHATATYMRRLASMPFHHYDGHIDFVTADRGLGDPYEPMTFIEPDCV